MIKHESPPNNILELLRKKRKTRQWLFKKIDTSEAHLSRLINGRSPLTQEWVLKISKAFKVPASEVVGIKVGKASSAVDDNLIGSIIGWLHEASDLYNIPLSRDELAALTSFVFKQCNEHRMRDEHNRLLAHSVVRVKSIYTQKTR